MLECDQIAPTVAFARRADPGKVHTALCWYGARP